MESLAIAWDALDSSQVCVEAMRGARDWLEAKWLPRTCCWHGAMGLHVNTVLRVHTFFTLCDWVLAGWWKWISTRTLVLSTQYCTSTLPRHGDQQAFERGESRNEGTVMREVAGAQWARKQKGASCCSPPEDSVKEGRALVQFLGNWWVPKERGAGAGGEMINCPSYQRQKVWWSSLGYWWWRTEKANAKWKHLKPLLFGFSCQVWGDQLSPNALKCAQIS